MASPAQRAALGTEGIDAFTSWWIRFAVDGKFYPLFALLFGVGVAVQLRRAGARRPEPSGEGGFRTRFRRRMAVLMVIGLLHATLLWFGDILSLYAVVGFVLLAFLRKSPTSLLRWSGASLLAPIVVSFSWLAVRSWVLPAPGDGIDPGYGPATLLPVFGSGSYLEVLEANAAFLRDRWLLALQSGRLFKLLGMFLLGLAVGRKGIFEDPAAHAKLLRRTLLVGLLLGVPANLALASLLQSIPDRPPSLLGSLRASVYAVAAPSLSLAYAAGFTLLFQRPAAARLLSALEACGRASLSNYLLQTAAGVALFYGYGAGLWGSLGMGAAVLLIAAIFLTQAVLSRAWLQRFRYGPVEWAWRCLSYGRRLPLRLAPGVVSEAELRSQ